MAQCCQLKQKYKNILKITREVALNVSIQALTNMQEENSQELYRAPVEGAWP